jgi:hypothetical protein
MAILKSIIIVFIININTYISMIQQNNDLTTTTTAIKLKTYENTNIELKSIFDLHTTTNTDDLNTLLLNKNNKNFKQKERLFWSFKRIYFDFNKTEHLSNNDVMIALDNEVEENLKLKYTIIDNYNYNLLIKNLTFMDSGYYICNIWNQKKLVYELIVNSKILLP